MTEDAALPGASAPPRRRPPGVIPWPEIRAAYEGSDTPLQLIAAAYGIGVTDIYPRAEREGWTLRRDRRALERKARQAAGSASPPPRAAPPKGVDRSRLVERMFRAVERQIEEIEIRAAGRAGEPDARDARTLGALARTLDLLIGLEKTQRAETEGARREARGDIDELRRELARRIASLGGS